MAWTAQTFLASNPFFAGRKEPAVAAKLARASRMYDQALCGELYDDIVEAQTVVLLLRDPGGSPTSKTKESSMADEAQKTLDDLLNRVPIRMAVIGGR